MNLDTTDVNILKVLQDNGRLSFRQISERVKVSVPTVSNKISNMENMGVIRGYQADMDTERLGEISVILNIKAKPSDLRQVAEHFEEEENVRTIFTLSNGHLLMICTFTDSHRINEFIKRLGNISEIVEYDIANIVSVLKEDHRALVKLGASVVLECAQCRKDIWDEALKIKLEGRDYYLCSEECVDTFQEKFEKKAASSG
ncbi:MAG: winged helix-turn-helix transcriptional regulator [Methanomassiliicoccales archaeon]